jgi:hypothetical protein
MNRKFYLLSLLLILFACEKERVVSSETNYEVENHSTKDVVYAAKTEVGDNSLYLKPQDSGKLCFRREEKRGVETYPMGENLFDLVEHVKSYEQAMYNLTDTSKYVRISGLAASKQDSLFDASRRNSLEGDVFNRLIRVVIQITDSLLTITEKDYAMLDKFKEYYAQK